jgi:hypothetical protein
MTTTDQTPNPGTTGPPRRSFRAALLIAALALAVVGCASSSSSHPAAGVNGQGGNAAPGPHATETSASSVLQADGYTVDPATLTGLSQAQINLGLIDLATGTRGGDAEQVLVFGGHPTAPLCTQTPALCTPAGVASEIPDQDPGTRASASGHILRITGTIATFRKDGLPV